MAGTEPEKESWKLTIACTRNEAEAIEADEITLALLEPPPVLMTSERIADDADAWQLDAYFEDEPAGPTIEAVCALVGRSPREAVLGPVPPEDWVTLSQAGIEPVLAGRFYIHTSANRGAVPQDATPFLIEAGLAFGTGQHDTTTGCLVTLDMLKRHGARFRNIVDVGTGTGVLAFAAMHLWPRAYATASDIDPVSIETVRDNARANDVALGDRPGRLALACAAGLDHPLLTRRAPYDLVIANILAGPLIDLATSLAGALAEGGTLILAGLLADQAERVARAYRRQGMRVAGRIDGDWPTLRLVKRRRYGHARASRAGGGRGEAPGYGSW